MGITIYEGIKDIIHYRMEKLIQTKAPYQYAIENLRDDPDWGFLYSYTIETIGEEDFEANKSFIQLQKQRAKLLESVETDELDIADPFQR